VIARPFANPPVPVPYRLVESSNPTQAGRLRHFGRRLLAVRRPLGIPASELAAEICRVREKLKEDFKFDCQDRSQFVRYAGASGAFKHIG
jgi:hypothetical protein